MLATVPLPDEPEVAWGITAGQGLGYFLGDDDTGGRRSAFGHQGIGGNPASPTPSTDWPWASP